LYVALLLHWWAPLVVEAVCRVWWLGVECVFGA